MSDFFRPTPIHVPATGITSYLAKVLRAWRRAARRRRTRRQLSMLNEHMARDIGMSFWDMEREVRKSFPWHTSFPWRRENPPAPYR